MPKLQSYVWTDLKQLIRSQFLPRDNQRVLMDRLSKLKWDTQKPVLDYLTKVKQTCFRLSESMTDHQVAVHIERGMPDYHGRLLKPIWPVPLCELGEKLIAWEELNHL